MGKPLFIVHAIPLDFNVTENKFIDIVSYATVQHTMKIILTKPLQNGIEAAISEELPWEE